MPPVNLHYTRHTYATLLLASGQPLKAVSETLGHGDTRTTETIYNHITEEGHARVADKIGDLLICQEGQKDRWQQKGAYGEAPFTLVRPGGLEPSTFRSGIWQEPLHILAVGCTHQRDGTLPTVGTLHGPALLCTTS